jgi:hypothetical protein
MKGAVLDGHGSDLATVETENKFCTVSKFEAYSEGTFGSPGSVGKVFLTKIVTKVNIQHADTATSIVSYNHVTSLLG